MSGKTNLKTSLIMAVLLVGIQCAIAAGEVIYVDANAPPSGTGQTWATAYRYLLDALAVESSGDEI